MKILMNERENVCIFVIMHEAKRLLELNLKVIICKHASLLSGHAERNYLSFFYTLLNSLDLTNYLTNGIRKMFFFSCEQKIVGPISFYLIFTSEFVLFFFCYQL